MVDQIVALPTELGIVGVDGIELAHNRADRDLPRRSNTSAHSSISYKRWIGGARRIREPRTRTKDAEPPVASEPKDRPGVVVFQLGERLGFCMKFRPFTPLKSVRKNLVVW